MPFADHALPNRGPLAARLVTDVVANDPDSGDGSWDLLDMQPVVGGARKWRETVRYVDGVLAEPELAASRLIVGVGLPPARGHVRHRVPEHGGQDSEQSRPQRRPYRHPAPRHVVHRGQP